MNETTLETLRRNAQRVTKKYRDELLKKFLLSAKKLNSELNKLCETSIDEEHFIYLKDAGIAADKGYYKAWNREMVCQFIQVLEEIEANEEEAIKIFSDAFKQNNDYYQLAYYEAFEEMYQLMESAQDVKFALDFLNITLR